MKSKIGIKMVVAILLAFVVGLVCSTLPLVQKAQAQVLDLLPLPATWATSTGSYFRINSNAKPEIKPSGSATNYYTGMTTNIALFGGTTNQFRIQVKNGIIVNVVGPAEDN